MDMISLIGEQPLPNLLPARFLAPQRVLMLHTQRTEGVSRRLANMLPQATLLSVDPYDILAIEAAIRQELATHHGATHEWVFNLTGGTKAMAIAAYRLAEETRSAFVYFQSEGRRSLLHHYAWSATGLPALIEQAEVSGIISIRDYVVAHAGAYHITGPAKDTGGRFEEAVAAILRPICAEVEVGVRLSGALDADIVLRSGNRVAVIEAKTGKKALHKEGIDQLNTIAGPEYLGTYTSKILVIDQQWDKTQSNLRELAIARNIIVVELPSYGATGVVDCAEAERLLDAVKARL